MEKEIDELQRQFTHNQCSQDTSKFDDSDIHKEITVDFGQNFSKNKQFGVNHQPRLNGSLGDAQYIGEDIELDSDDSLDESNSRELPSLPPPPITHNEVMSRLMQEPSHYQSEPVDEVIL